MKIYITTGKGYGKTLISAFDDALRDAGVYNYNLLLLSSIIPPQSEIVEESYPQRPEEYGHRLYVVKAECRSRETGKYVGAAIGWYQMPDGRGVFVEHQEMGQTEAAVRSDLEEDVTNSIKDLCVSRQYTVEEKNIKMKMSVVRVTDSAACGLVLAVYKAESW